MAGEIGDYCGIDFIGGGLGAVDKIDGAVLQDKDHFLVVTPTVFAPLSLDADSGAGENSPQIIAPNTNPGDKRWILTKGVFAGLTLYGDVDLAKTGGSLDLSLTITGAGNYAAIQRCTSDDSGIMFGAFDDGYSGVANYAGQTVIQTVTADLIVAAMTAGKKIKFHTGGRDAGHLRMTIADAGVGVGTDDPDTGLEINVPMDTTNGLLKLRATNGDNSGFTLWNKLTGGHGSSRSWQIAANYKAYGNLDFLMSPAVDGDPTTHVASFNKDGKFGVNDINPGSWVDVDGDINTTDVYKVDDTQVVSNQGAAVANATDAATTMARLNDLLARARAHGLIAT